MMTRFINPIETPAGRLIVAADFKPREGSSVLSVRDDVMDLARKLRSTGVYLKVNSALLLAGYSIIDEIHDLGLYVFADLKLNDIPETLATHGAILAKYKPKLVTVMCSAGIAGCTALKEQLPTTEVLGVTLLTSLNQQDSLDIYGAEPEYAVTKLARIGYDSALDGFICSPAEAKTLHARYGSKAVPDGKMSINTPGVRPLWSLVRGDDQNSDRVMTPAKAIQAGADRLVIGRPITQASDPLVAALRSLEEIASVKT